MVVEAVRIAVYDNRNDVPDMISYVLQNICRKEKIAAHIEFFSTADELCEAFCRDKYSFELVMLYTGPGATECAEYLRTLNNSFRLVFLTSYDMTDIYDLFQYDISSIIPAFMSEEYMVREFTRILKDIEKYKARYLTFEVKVSENSFAERKIKVSDILYLTVVERKIYLKTQRGMYTLRHRSFTDLKNLMFGYNFIEISRFYIVNLDYVGFIEGNEMRLDNGTPLKISRRHLKNVTDAFSGVFEVPPLRKRA